MTKRRTASATHSPRTRAPGVEQTREATARRQARGPAMRAALALLAAVLLVQGCTLLSGFRLDVQQGNIIEAEKLDQVQVGMTERQVQFLLGSPVLNAAYRESDRWDYVYYRRPGFGSAERARATVHFTGGRVERIDRDVPPTEPDVPEEDSLAPVG